MGTLIIRRRPAVQAFHVATILGLSLIAAACPGSSPTTPTPPSTTPVVSSISPLTGSTFGGTDVTIGGANFTSAATVVIGGVPATNVRVSGPTGLLATTGAHPAGLADVVVSVGAQTAMLASAFTYVVPPAPRITAVSPTSGTTAGGTVVTIAGTDFGIGASVRIGGVAATGVEVVNATTVRAVTGPRTSGLVDVTVTVGTLAGTLSAAYSYVPPAINPLPVITAMSVQGTRPGEPANFADLGEEVVLTVSVTDAETQPDSLVYEWSADVGVFTGTGRSVRWRAPAAHTAPALVPLTVRVTEVTAAASGEYATPAGTQSVTASTTVRLHDSTKEIGVLAVRFLVDFSEQKLTPENIVRNFWDGCSGKAAELSDVRGNQKDYTISSFIIGNPTSSSVTFGGVCALNEKGDGCMSVPCDWSDIRLVDKEPGRTWGTDLLSAVYRESRWWLCSSRFDGKTTHTPLPAGVRPFIR